MDVEKRHPRRPRVWGLILLASLGASGCQVEVGGQTLPSGHYLSDDIQYYAPGPEFLLTREATAQKAFREEEIFKETP
ncbi:MAG: hypothetical protein ACC645_16900 [Pirellulales bacterium]